MFGLFKPKPPLSPWEKAWTEHRLLWTATQLGFDRILKTPTMIPSFEGLPVVTDLDSAGELMRFICTWMQIDSDSLALVVHRDQVSPDAIAATDSHQQRAVEIVESDLVDRDLLISKVSRAAAQHVVETLGLQPEDCPDYGWMIDLVPIYLGLGVFTANDASRLGQSSPSQYDIWNRRFLNPLPSRITGYACALRSYVRQDQSVTWAQQLRPDAYEVFEESLRFLQKTDATAFAQEKSKKSRTELSEQDLLQELSSTSGSQKILAMWEVNSRQVSGELRGRAQLSDELMGCLQDKHPDVRAMAAGTLAIIDNSQQAASDIATALTDSHEDVRTAAAAALAHFPGVDDESLVFDLTNALKDDARSVVFAAAQSLTHFGHAAGPASKMLLKRLRRTLVECREDEATTFVWALSQITEDAELVIREFFTDADAEFNTTALEILAALREPARAT